MLSLTYTYPQPGRSMSPEMTRRWQRFMAGVKKHEEKHGSIAREMVRAAEASVKGLKISNDPGCRKTRVEVKKRADRVYATYEARQLKFDAREHRDGGNIDHLILKLVKGQPAPVSPPRACIFALTVTVVLGSCCSGVTVNSTSTGQ